ncbi:hypothetical protein [Vibrio sp. STUT-A11]|uniref:hypothetical protein n=1 Tax=Vibrio sp. STUT-A11 TaxID=2976236 RepID=UPI00222F7973|nr:hypothetical protein [Vibrio sp. STUT-A11]BDR13977.1 hypothetical protein VspSTUT11_19530 [Vibrio sp. STUT-A11]
MAIYVIAAVLFQIYLLATMALNPSQVHNKNWLSEAQGEKILLCTAEGFKWVDIKDLIEDNTMGSPSNTDVHDPLKFSCPLLDVCQFSISVLAMVIAAIALWLCRVTAPFVNYLHIHCQRKIYLSLAPKQSPPTAFLA